MMNEMYFPLLIYSGTQLYFDAPYHNMLQRLLLVCFKFFFFFLYLIRRQVFLAQETLAVYPAHPDNLAHVKR